MDAHRLLMDEFHEKTGIKVGYREYAYVEKNGKKAIELDLDPADYEESYGVKKIVTNEFVFTRGKKTEKLSNGMLSIYYTYEVNPKTDYSDPIDTGKKQYGVICPKGKFYSCPYAKHNDLEYWLQQRNLIGEVAGYSNNTYEMEGWVKLSGAMMSTVEAVFQEKVTKYNFQKEEDIVLATHKITKEQVEALVKYITSLGRELINYNYYWYNIEDFKLILNTPLDRYEFEEMYGLYEFEGEDDELQKQNG